jgi:hypothetical protein
VVRWDQLCAAILPHPITQKTACRGPRLWRNGRVGFSFLVYTISKNALALMTPMSNLLRRRVAMKGEEYGGRALPIRCHAGFSGQPDVIVKRFRNYCGLIKIARSGFPWEKTTKRSLAFPDFLQRGT